MDIYLITNLDTKNMYIQSTTLIT